MEKQQRKLEVIEAEQEPEVMKSKARKRRRRRRRWVRRILIAVAFLVVLVILAPWLLSTHAGTSLILSFVNKGIRGRAEIGDLSLSWFGPIRIKRLRLLDATDREILSINRVAVKIGMWGAIRAPEHFLEVTVESPRVALYEREDGGLSMVEALRPKKQRSRKPVPSGRKKERPRKAVRSPRGKVIVRNGNVHVKRANGRELTVRDLEGAFDLNSLGTIAGNLRLALATGGVVELEMELRDLVRKGRFAPSAAGGRISLRTPKEVELGPVLDLATGEAQTSGRLNLSLDVKVRPGTASVQFDTNIKELCTRRVGRAEVQPMDLASNGKVDVDLSSTGLDGIAGDVNLSGEGVQLATQLTYRNSQRQPPPTLDEILAAALEGKRIELPQGSVRANGEVDLGRLAQAVPALLNLRKDVRLTGGKVLVDRISIEGGIKPEVQGSVRVTELSAIQTDPATDLKTTIRWEPITVVLDASLVEKEGLRIKTARLESDFATFHGQGNPKKMDLRLEADLARLFDQGGRLEMSAEVQTVDSVVSLQGNGTASNLSIKSEDSRWATNKVVLNYKGTYHQEEKGLFGQVELATDDSLALLAGKGEKPDKLRVGPIQIKATVTRDSAKAPFVSTGRSTVGSASMNDEPLTDKKIELSWSDMNFSPKDKTLTAREIKLDGQDLLTLSTKGTKARLGKKPSVEGKFELSADLAKFLSAARPFAGWEKPPDIAGGLVWSGEVTTGEDLIVSRGTATIDELTVGTGETAVRQGDVEFKHGTVINLQNEIITFEEFSLTSQPLSLALTGKIEKFKDDRILDFSGHYRGSWEHLTALLNELAPKVKSETGLALAGMSESDLKITGPANQPTIQPTFRGVSTNKVRVDWTSGQVVGLELGRPANFQPMFSQGQLILSNIRIPASGGSLNLNGVVNFAGASPTLRMEGSTRLIDKVRITPEVGRMLLSRINPIFGQLASLEGELSLSLSNLDLPLGDRILTGGSGIGHLDLSNLTFKPDGILATLLQLGGVLTETSSNVRFSGVDFTIKDGRIEYDNLTMAFGKEFDLTFRGSVGFNDALELVVSVPVGPTLLRRLDVKGPLDAYTRLLARDKVRLDIPIRGTRLSPSLGKVNLESLLETLTKGLLEQGVPDVGDLFKMSDYLLKNPFEAPKVPAETRKKPPDLIKKPGDTIQKPDVTPEQLLIDSLLDLLKKQQENPPGGNKPKK